MTARECYFKSDLSVSIEDEDDMQNLTKLMIEFAQYHVEQALKSASENIDQDKLDYRDYFDYSCGVESVPNTSNIEAILESYPKENIK